MNKPDYKVWNRIFYTHSQTKTTNRIVKLLERADIKIRLVSSLITTKCTLETIRLLSAGENDVESLLLCLLVKFRSKKERMRLALAGVLRESDCQILGFFDCVKPIRLFHFLYRCSHNMQGQNMQCVRFLVNPPDISPRNNIFPLLVEPGMITVVEQNQFNLAKAFV